MHHQSTRVNLLFMRLLHVKIFPHYIVCTTNATLFGALAHQMLFQGTSLNHCLSMPIIWMNIKLTITFQPLAYAFCTIFIWDVGVENFKQWVYRLQFSIIKITNELDGIPSSCNCIQLWVHLFKKLLSTPLVVPKPYLTAIFYLKLHTTHKSIFTCAYTP